jgi:hypothetical protein
VKLDNKEVPWLRTHKDLVGPLECESSAIEVYVLVLEIKLGSFYLWLGHWEWLKGVFAEILFQSMTNCCSLDFSDPVLVLTNEIETKRCDYNEAVLKR